MIFVRFFLNSFCNIPINKQRDKPTNRSTHLFIRRQWKHCRCLGKEINSLLKFIYCIYVVHDATILLGLCFYLTYRPKIYHR